MAVVDTENNGRIVRTYTDSECRRRGGAAKASAIDARKWNTSAPVLVPVFVPRNVRVRQLGNGTVFLEQVEDLAFGLTHDKGDKRSLYRDFKYVGL